MKTIDRENQTTTTAADDTTQAGKAGIIVTCLAAASMGIWGIACLFGALASNGIGGIVQGFMTAITGM